MSLLELVKIQMNCSDVDDLRLKDKWQGKYLAAELEKIDVDFPLLDEWNDVIRYVIGGEPQDTNENAKEYLLAALRAN